MKTQSLLKKCAVLFMLLVGIAGMTEAYAKHFDFSAVCSTGQTLYYRIIDYNNVALTYPNYNPNSTYEDYYNGYTKPTGYVVIPEYVYDNSKRYNVSSIDNNALYRCINVTGVHIPNSITTIGVGAFMYCSGLTGRMVIPNTVTSIAGNTFYLCQNINSITIPNTITAIGPNAFYRCQSLTTVTLPESMLTIGDGAFDGCLSLTTVTLPESLLTIGNGAFDGCSNLNNITIPSSVTAIGSQAFINTGWYNNQPNGVLYLDNWCVGYKNYVPESIDIPEGIIGICDYAFYDTETIINVLTIPESVLFIGYSAFRDCIINTLKYNAINCSVTGIDDWDYQAVFGYSTCSRIIIGEHVVSLPALVFREILGISELTIPNTITSIDDAAFTLCDMSELSELTIPNSVTSIGNGAFTSCDMSGLSELTIPNSVTSIGEYAFWGCGMPGLSELTIPNSVTSIGSQAFSYFTMSGSAEFTIPNSVTSIGAYAFSNCRGVKSFYLDVATIPSFMAINCPDLITVTIGPSVSLIENDAFTGCSNLNTIIALGSTPPTLEANAFSNISPVAALFVPCGKQMAYFSSWNIFDYNNIHEDCAPHTITINPNITYGIVTASAYTATMGEAVTLYVNPDYGYVIQSLTVYNANNPNQTVGIDNNSFAMPPYDVYVDATFGWISVNENNKLIASIYPNPTSGIVKIEAENIQNISIYNVLGEQLYNTPASGDVFEYDFSNHNVGIYIIRLETAQGTVTKQIAVK